MSDNIAQFFNQLKTQITNKLTTKNNTKHLEFPMKKKPPQKLQRQNAMSFTNIYTTNKNPMNIKHPKQTHKIAYIM